MPFGDVETFNRDGKWHIRIEGAGEILATFDTRVEAVQAGKEEAREREVEHIVHNLDGTIAERESYGRDPRSIRG